MTQSSGELKFIKDLIVQWKQDYTSLRLKAKNERSQYLSGVVDILGHLEHAVELSIKRCKITPGKAAKTPLKPNGSFADKLFKEKGIDLR